MATTRKKRSVRGAENAERRDAHAKTARWELKAAQAAIDEAERAMAGRRPVDVAVTSVEGITSAAMASCEARAAGDARLEMEANVAMRRAGELVSWAVDELRGSGNGARVANPTRRNQRGRQPGVTSSMLIRVYSTTLLTGTDEVYLVINTDGEVMDAIMAPQDNFAPVADAGYAGLPILEMDVTGQQYRKLVRLAKRLAEIDAYRPTYRPGRGGIRPSREERLATQGRGSSTRDWRASGRTGDQSISDPGSSHSTMRSWRSGRDAMSSLDRTSRAANPNAERLKRQLMR